MVSVIIPTHKGAEIQTKRCVESIERSTYKDVEILVVNEGLERSKQRNIGISRAKGEFLLILDSDTEVSVKLIEECVEKIKFCDAIYIPEIITTKGWFGDVRNWEREFYTATAVDVVRFVVAKNCPLFDTRLSGPEDSDWDRRIEGGRTTSYYPIFHNDEVSVIKYFMKKAYYSKSMDIYKEKWPDDKILTFKYRCWTIFVEDGKWIKLLSNPFYAILMFTMIAIRGVIYKCAKKY